MASEQEILQTLAVLTNAYPANHLETGSVALYVRLLSDIPAALLQAAVLDYIAHSTWFPTIGELRQTALDLQREADPQPDAHEAWAEVLEAIARVGHAGQPQFSHPLIAEVVQLTGWHQLCMTDIQDLRFERHNFITIYNARLERERLRALRPAEVARLMALSHPINELPKSTEEM